MTRWLVAALFTVALAGCAAVENRPADPSHWAAGKHRSPANVARDAHRHPLETLAFFGVRRDSTVVEVLPGSAGYYVEILAPWLKGSGRYIAANRDEAAAPQYLADHRRLLARLEAEPELYGEVVVTKPGGVLGVVDHRGRTDLSQEAQMKSGYVREDYAIRLIESAGFRLVGRSEVNANPRDTKDHPEGVWTLPPSYRLKDRDRAKYAAIGESDRFTLKFVKN